MLNKLLSINQSNLLLFVVIATITTCMTMLLETFAYNWPRLILFMPWVAMVCVYLNLFLTLAKRQAWFAGVVALGGGCILLLFRDGHEIINTASWHHADLGYAVLGGEPIQIIPAIVFAGMGLLVALIRKIL